MENNLEIKKDNFLRNTYAHVALAIVAFAIVESLVVKSPIADKMMELLGKSQYSWFVVLGAFMGASWVAQKWAMSGVSKAVQYAGLALYIVAEAIIFIPLIYAALSYAPEMLQSAGLVTASLVAGITAIAFFTKKDFSFLGRYLTIGGFVALGVISAGIIFKGFTLGIWFSGAMALFAGVAVLHSTSNIIHKYNRNQYVAASLDLFASIALMFFYILQMFMGNRD